MTWNFDTFCYCLDLVEEHCSPWKLVWLISYALLGNGGNSLFAMDLIPPIVTKNGVTGRFLKISPVLPFFAFFLARGVPDQAKIWISSQKCLWKMKFCTNPVFSIRNSRKKFVWQYQPFFVHFWLILEPGGSQIGINWYFAYIRSTKEKTFCVLRILW